MHKTINVISKTAMVEAIGLALSSQRGLAIGKLGGSEQATLMFHLACRNSLNLLEDPLLRPLYLAFKYRCQYQTGIFPTDFNFLVEYASFYSKKVSCLDFIGLFNSPNNTEIVKSLPPTCNYLPYIHTEPDRSDPYDSTRCYLPLFRNKKVLIVSPFASFARERAKKNLFESVWQRVNGKWFYPHSVQALDIPYSFAGQTKTFEAYGNSICLYDEITYKMDQIDYDVALIAAGSLAIPLGTHAKSRNRVGISLGGHLQVLFGILGDRWALDPYWKKHYINHSWSRLPDNLIPRNARLLADQSAYW